MLSRLLAIVLAAFVPLAFAQGTGNAPANPSSDTALRVVAGKVELIEGDVRFYDANRQLRVPKLGDWVYQGDSIFTGPDGEVQLSMEDGGYIGVRPNTKMQIIDYKAEGGPDDTSVIGLLEGSFRSITGWIANLNRQNYVVRTPTATIGVRGTEHEPLVLPEGSTEGEPGTYDRVYVGETELGTAQGSVSVKPNQAGFISRSGLARPRVLDRVPGFFRPTRNEGRFQGLHGRLHRQLQQRLQVRRQLVEQRHKQKLDASGERQPALQRHQDAREKLQEQGREQQQKLREERRQKAEKARLEREQKRREAAERERERRAAKAEHRE